MDRTVVTVSRLHDEPDERRHNHDIRTLRIEDEVYGAAHLVALQIGKKERSGREGVEAACRRRLKQPCLVAKLVEALLQGGRAARSLRAVNVLPEILEALGLLLVRTIECKADEISKRKGQRQKGRPARNIHVQN